MKNNDAVIQAYLRSVNLASLLIGDFLRCLTFVSRMIRRCDDGIGGPVDTGGTRARVVGSPPAAVLVLRGLRRVPGAVPRPAGVLAPRLSRAPRLEISWLAARDELAPGGLWTRVRILLKLRI